MTFINERRNKNKELMEMGFHILQMMKDAGMSVEILLQSRSFVRTNPETNDYH
jgi:NAD(P)H-hydrate repair Nnr-like enzyme with NAD(P)H-hydrate epimerase domain